MSSCFPVQSSIKQYELVQNSTIDVPNPSTSAALSATGTVGRVQRSWSQSNTYLSSYMRRSGIGAQKSGRLAFLRVSERGRVAETELGEREGVDGLAMARRSRDRSRVRRWNRPEP